MSKHTCIATLTYGSQNWTKVYGAKSPMRALEKAKKLALKREADVQRIQVLNHDGAPQTVFHEDEGLMESHWPANVEIVSLEALQDEEYEGA